MAYIFITKKEKTNWKYILIIVILALIVAGETLYLAKQEVKIPEIKLSQKPTQDETANWKTYRNEEYGFEIKYPNFEDWHFTETPTRTGGWVIRFESYPKEPEKKYSIILIEIGNGYSSINDWMGEGRILFEEPIKKGEMDLFADEIKVGTEKGYKTGEILLPEGSKTDLKIILFRGGNIFILTQDAPPECKNLECKIFNQMLSTFTLY